MIIRKKKIFNLMFAATLIGAVNVLSSFKMACDDQETATQNDTTVQKVESAELIRTSQSWDGVELSDYLEGHRKTCRWLCSTPKFLWNRFHHHSAATVGSSRMIACNTHLLAPLVIG
jgi:hypothetical protein